MEDGVGTYFTDVILLNADVVDVQEMKRLIGHADWEGCLLKCTEKAPLIASVVNQGDRWIKLWDTAMDLGTRHTQGLKTLTRMLAHHQLGPKPCEENYFNPSPIDHLLRQHQRELNLDNDNFLAVDQLRAHLVESDISLCTSSGNFF